MQDIEDGGFLFPQDILVQRMEQARLLILDMSNDITDEQYNLLRRSVTVLIESCELATRRPPELNSVHTFN